MNSYATAGILVIIATICQIAAIGFFIGFVVRLILFIVGKSKIAEAKRNMDDMQTKLRKIKRRENADKNDIADAQDDVDVSYQRYKQAVSARAKHQFHFILCIAVSFVLGLATVVLTLAGVGASVNAAQQETQNSYNQFMNPSGSYDSNGEDGWSVNNYMQDLDNSLNKYGY